MVRECLKKSPMIGVGESFVTKFGDIRLIKIYDNSSGMIGIKPNGWSEVVIHTVDWRVEDIGPMTVETNFYTLGGGGCNCYVCGPDKPAPPETCTQTFKLQDQSGNPLNGNVQIGTTAVTVLGTGTITLEKGKAYTAVASYSNLPTQTKTFTSCSTITFTFNVPTNCRQEFKVYDGLVGDAPGATVTINGIVYTTNSTGYTSVLLTTGKEYTATGKFGDRSKTYTFTACQDILKFRLVTIIVNPGWIYYKAYNSRTNAILNATVLANGELQSNKTPGRSDILPIGSYTLTFSLAGYLTETKTVEVIGGDIVNITVKMTEEQIPTTGYIKCQAYDSVTNAALSATIRIDGTTIAPKTPHTTPALPIGSHTVSFLLVGYSPKTVTVTVKAGQTVNAYGSMVKLALPDVAGFDVKVNVPGMLPKTSLHISQVTKVPLTNTWWDIPFGLGMRWDNISNGVFKARATSADSNPTPNSHTGFAANKDYAVYVGTSAISLFHPDIIYRSTDKVTEIDLTGNYIDWVSKNVCAMFGISPANCPFFVATSVNDAAFLLELWSVITKHENLAGEHTLPTALDYALIPVAIFGLFSPGISEGAIASMLGKRFGKLIELSKKGVIDAKELAQDPRLSTFILRATKSQFDDLVLHLEEGNLKTARILLGVTEDIVPTNLELNALDRAVKLTKKTDESLAASNSIEKLPTVLSKFNPKFTKIFENALKWVTEHPSETVTVGSAGIVIVGLWYALSKLTGNVDDSFKASGITMSSTSWGGKDYLNTIDTYKYNVLDAERMANWTLFCDNLLAWEKEVDNFEVFVTANQAKLNVEGYYGIFTNAIAAYRKAIEIKNEVHSCVDKKLPDKIDAEVMEILDSDTVKIKYAGTDYTVRLLGINAPEGKYYNYTCTGVRSPFLIRRLVTPGKECIEEETWTGTEEMYNASKVWLGKNLPVHQIATFRSDLDRQFDKYGRLLAIVHYNNVDICRESLKAGQSVVFFYDDNTRVDKTRFLSSEKIAKDAKLGVWAVEAGLGTIRCVSTPTAAEVWMDGKYTGKKTISSVAYLSNIPVGVHTVSFKKIINDVLNSCTKSVTVTQDTTVNAECTLSPGDIPTVPSTCSGMSQLFHTLISYYDKDKDKKINNTEVSFASYDHHIGLISDVEKEVVESFWAKDCTLTDEVPTPPPGVTPTPTPPPEKATWQIGDVKNEAGTTLGAAKVYVDNVYVKHYAPELLTFCTGCSCDTVVPCGFGSHTVSIKKTGYQDWNKTRTLGSSDSFTDNPVMKLIPAGTYPVTLLSQPTGATIKVDGKAI